MVSIKTSFRFGPMGHLAEVEVVRVQAIPGIIITGLAGEIVKESRERVVGSLSTLGFTDIPTGRLLIHLVPAAERKQGSHFDLAIALAILAIENKIPFDSIRGWAVLGELTLEGRIRGVAGAVSLTEPLLNHPEITKIIVPKDNASEVSLFKSDKIYLAENVSQLIGAAYGKNQLPRPPDPQISPTKTPKNIFANIQGQTIAKRALQISIAGRHHLLMVGSPGIGKSLLASAAADLQPPLSPEEIVETLKCQGDSAQTNISNQRPFRSPHHSISAGAFLGGGSGTINPGEITLAHRGLLFLDEFPEFRRDSIEGLREPLETGVVHLHRVGRHLTLPSSFTLIAAMNPCPCGYFGDKSRACSCGRERQNQYSKRISGPILDRLDMTVSLEGQDNGRDDEEIENVSQNPYESVANAANRQRHRYKHLSPICQNGDLPWGDNWNLLGIPDQAETWIRALARHRPSLRAVHKLMRVARTIADLDGQEGVTRENIHEAWDLRCRLSTNSLIAF